MCEPSRYDKDFFYFTQKTAYEIKYGLVGSELYIRDRENLGVRPKLDRLSDLPSQRPIPKGRGT